MEQFTTTSTVLSDSECEERTIADEYDTELAEFPTPQVGDIVGRRFVIESTLGPRRFVARDRQTAERFEVRRFTWLTPNSAAFRSAVANARSCSLGGHAQLGIVTTVSSCAMFGPFAALGLMTIAAAIMVLLFMRTMDELLPERPALLKISTKLPRKTSVNGRHAPGSERGPRRSRRGR